MNYFYILPVINLKSLVSIWLTRLLTRRSYSKRDLNPHSRNGQRILSPSCLPFHHSSILSKRAENETRTRDPNLGKVMLYQLSYFRIFLTGANVGSFIIRSKHLHRFLCFILFLRVLFRLFRLFQNQIRLLLDSLIPQFCHCKGNRYFRHGCGVPACRK